VRREREGKAISRKESFRLGFCKDHRKRRSWEEEGGRTRLDKKGEEFSNRGGSTPRKTGNAAAEVGTNKKNKKHETSMEPPRSFSIDIGRTRKISSRDAGWSNDEAESGKRRNRDPGPSARKGFSGWSLQEGLGREGHRTYQKKTDGEREGPFHEI